VDTQFLLSLYKTMVSIRRFEERSIELYQQGQIHGTIHPYIGQEAIAAGVCGSLEPEDYVLSTHRGHGHCIAKGADLSLMMAELLGRETGYCKGRGGSMHIAALEVGVLGANGIVAGGVPIACGAGLGAQFEGKGRVVVVFFGDGASSQGALHEAMNMASLWKLPVVFVCENNGYAVSTPVKEGVCTTSIADRAEAYCMPGRRVDGNDVLAVQAAAEKAIKRARHGDGPSLIEAVSYRWEGHFYGDPMLYRSKEELEEWKAKDPLPRFAAHLRDHGFAREEQLAKIRDEVQVAVNSATSFALNSPQPSVDEVGLYVYASSSPESTGGQR
jgi:pyruvate dehydrogenase E1 component alpha subunit